MRKLFLVSLISLAVGLGGCKNNEPEPDAYQALQGDWDYAYSKLYFYDTAGMLIEVLKSPPLVVPREPMRISATFIEHYSSYSAYNPTDLLPYTRQGDQLTITFPFPSTLPPTYTISHLSSDSLTLDTPLRAITIDRLYIIKGHYARQ